MRNTSESASRSESAPKVTAKTGVGSHDLLGDIMESPMGNCDLPVMLQELANAEAKVERLRAEIVELRKWKRHRRKMVAEILKVPGVTWDGENIKHPQHPGYCLTIEAWHHVLVNL